MKTLISVWLAAGFALSLATAANATATLTPGSTSTDPLGIDNLVVGGTTYDVTFSLTTLNSFAEGSTLSNEASVALASALDALSVTALNNASPTSQYVLDVDNSLAAFEGPFCKVSCTVGGWGAGGGSDLTLGSSGDGAFYAEAADFTAVSTSNVPEPFSLSLFGAGLVGAAAMRSRKAKS